MGVCDMFWSNKTPFHSHVLLPMHWESWLDCSCASLVQTVTAAVSLCVPWSCHFQANSFIASDLHYFWLRPVFH